MFHATTILVSWIRTRRLCKVIVGTLAVARSVVGQAVVGRVGDGDLRIRVAVGEGGGGSGARGRQRRQGGFALMGKPSQPRGLLGESSPVFGLHQFRGELLVENGDAFVEIRPGEVNGRG